LPYHTDRHLFPTRRSSDLERDAVRDEEDGDDDGQPREVALDDVGAALRGGGETHPAQPGVPTRVQEDQGAERHREQHLDDGERLDRKSTRLNSSHQIISYA